jgi:nicotinate-nucleotide adenylyltransferase
VTGASGREAARGSRTRIGVYGGSFDPIHLGHLRAAEEVREQLALDRVIFVPAANPPHKPTRHLADGAARLAMIELAVADHSAFAASGIELERGGISYSVETVAEIARREPAAELWFLVGLDAWREIHLWRDVERFFELVNVAVVRRPPAPLETSIEHLPIAAREAFCYGPNTRSYAHRSGRTLTFLSIDGLDVSATAIRDALRDGRSVRYLVPPPVERYLREHPLYRSGVDIG